MTKCLQCGKQTEQPCKRPDCGYQSSAIASAKRKLATETSKANQRAANSGFQRNFDLAMQWAVKKGHVRSQDVDTLWHFAKQSPSAPAAYLAIVRSL